MPRTLPPETLQALRAQVGFMRDLGIFDLYRHGGLSSADPAEPETLPVSAASAQPIALPADAEVATRPEPAAVPIQREAPNAPPAPAIEPLSPFAASLQRSQPEPPVYSTPNPEDDAIVRARKNIPNPPPTEFLTPAIAPTDRPAALAAIRAEIGDCTRCALSAGRTTIVFGDGDPNARLLFVGEGPGADEDAQGLPFVGKAGQLLNNMITAMGLARQQVYIANIVKCRPPGNRAPETLEANTCSPFLFEQIGVIRPEVVVALGATAATYLMGARSPLSALRGRIHDLLGSKLIITYHPAFLLRDPRQKKEAWADLQIAMRELGLSKPG